MTLDPLLAFYSTPLIIVWIIYFATRIRREKRSAAILEEACEAGLTEPASLHPVINEALCMGCAACAKACPEGNVIGIINGKAKLIEPTSCIGHGACKEACPFNAIDLVFGTETRGIDIPNVGPDFQTNIPGIFIAGELGGMGLIRNAIEQGRQAMEELSRLNTGNASDMLDVVIIGGGPAGFSASLGAMEKKLSFKTLEQDSFGGTVSHFPRGKLVMTQPAILPIFGRVKFREINKEKLLSFWQKVARNTGLKIHYGIRVDNITPLDTGFTVQTNRGVLKTHSVLLAIGRRGTPRKLDVPGEEQTKVVYRLIDPDQYKNRNVLVVGGGDSALEAACSIADEPGTTVTLSYRSASFARAKQKNRQRVEALQATGQLNVLLSSNVKSINPESVELEQTGEKIAIENDAVIVCAGGILPTGFLKKIGIEVETKYGAT